MGNSIGGKRRVKVMKINGETMKVESGTEAGEITKTHPNYVVLESEAVKHFGIRAPPLKPDQKLDPKKLYFLLELPPQIQDQKLARRVRSNVTMSAKDRLESLMLARRSSSDLSVLKKTSGSGEEDDLEGSVRMRMRLRRREVEKLMRESGNEDEAAEKLMSLCMEKFGNGGDEVAENGSHGRAPPGFKPRQKSIIKCLGCVSALVDYWIGASGFNLLTRLTGKNEYETVDASSHSESEHNEHEHILITGCSAVVSL